MNDTQTTADAAEAIVRLLALHADASPLRIAQAALSVIPDAIVEEAPLDAMTLNRLSDDEAEFTGPGNARLIVHRGDWMERGRPIRVNVAILDAP